MSDETALHAEILWDEIANGLLKIGRNSDPSEPVSKSIRLPKHKSSPQPRTCMEVATLLVDKYRDRIRYCPETDQWLMLHCPEADQWVMALSNRRPVIFTGWCAIPRNWWPLMIMVHDVVMPPCKPGRRARGSKASRFFGIIEQVVTKWDVTAHTIKLAQYDPRIQVTTVVALSLLDHARPVAGNPS